MGCRRAVHFFVDILNSLFYNSFMGVNMSRNKWKDITILCLLITIAIFIAKEIFIK